MRFSVAANGQHEVRLPPSLEDLPEDDPKRITWDNVVSRIAWAYKSLIDAGVPAEDARGLLPTNIGTRIHYKTNLRGLAEHAGMRLCSQAQDEWKEVWEGIITALLNWGPVSDRWQQRAIAALFRPVCFSTGKCEFMAETDRWCRIRDRVQAHAAKGEPSVTWVDIDPHECLIPGAARMSPQTAEYLRSHSDD
jgi:thymidylate synthase ThyX